MGFREERCRPLPRRAAILGLLTALAIMLEACVRVTPAEVIADAKGYLDKGDANSAVVELKDVLQEQPDLPEARFLLGKAMVALDNPAGAEVELRRALQLGYRADEILPPLAEALLRTEKFDEVIGLEIGAAPRDPAARAALQTAVARAHAALGDAEQTDAAIASALEAVPDYVPALLMRARMVARAGDVDAALSIVDGVLVRAPTEFDAMTLRGDLLFERGDADGAAAVYRKVLAAQPAHFAASEALLLILLDKNDLEAAGRQLDALAKVRAGHPATLYLQARLATQKADLRLAEEKIQQLLSAAPDDPKVLQLAGAVALRAKDHLLAQARLAKLVQLKPHSTGARTMLATALVRAGDAHRALDVLEPVVRSGPADARTLTVAAGAAVLTGDWKAAQDFYARAAKLEPSSTHSRAGAALARVMGGDREALRDLASVASEDRATATDLTLISVLVNRRDYEGALEAIEQLDKKAPGGAVAPFLRGQTLAMRGDLRGARASLEKALTIDPKYFPAIDRLAALDYREERPQAARARFEALLKSDPTDARAMVALASLEELAGKPKSEVAALLSNEVKSHPTDPSLRRRLIRYHLAQRDYALAMSAAQAAVKALPNDPDMLAQLAASQLAAGEPNQAVSSYRALVTMRPKSPLPLLGLAEAHIANKSYDLAAETVQSAARLAPDSPAVVQMGARVDTLAARPDAALNRARALQARAPRAAAGFVIEGDLQYASGRWSAAATAYRAALEREPSATAIAERQYASLRAAGDAAKAESFGADWAKRHPDDARFAFFLAGRAIDDRKYERGESLLRRVLQLEPDNAMATNNLAWTLWAQKKPGALATAERANRLAPNRPLFMDTLAQALADDGQLGRALQLERAAVGLDPNAPELRLTLARLLLKTGDKSEAHAELRKLAALGGKFQKQDEVKQLLAAP